MLKIGKIVRHPSRPEWGKGTIVKVGSEDVKIKFSPGGLKTLRLSAISTPLIELMDQEFIDILNPCLGFYKSTTNFCEVVTEDDFTHELLKIKNRDKNVINQYSLKVLSILKSYKKYLKDSVICTVPSSTEGRTNTGITQFAEALLKASIFIDGIHLLKRSHTLPKNSTSSHRTTKDDHLRTIFIEKDSLIKNKTIFLIDDIRTTGISLESCREILETTGAAEVITMSLGQTVLMNDYINNPSHPARKKQSEYFQLKLNALSNLHLG